MEAGKNPNKFLIITLFSFLVIFAVGLIFVNNWLRETLKEEMIPAKSEPLSVVSKPKYKQPPIEAVEKSEAYSTAEKKSAVPEKSAGLEKQETEEAPVAAGALLN